MVGGQGLAGFAHDVRAGQAVLIAELTGHRHDGFGVFADGVVDRTVVARVGTVVVHTETAADIEVIQRQAKAAQLAEVAQRLAETGPVVADVGDLRTHVEVQQAHGVLHAGIDELAADRQQLGGRQAELALFAA